MEKRSSKLRIETSGEESNVEICGTRDEILFNLAALMNQICQKLNISPMHLTFILPGMIDIYQRTIRQAMEFDLGALRKQTGGDKA